MRTSQSTVMCMIALLALAGCRRPEPEDRGPAEVPKPAPAAEAPRTAVPIPLFLEHALEGRIEEMRAALGSGMSPNVADEDGRTPLMLSAFNGHVEGVKLLLAKGAVIGTRDATGRTALMYAATGPHVEIADLLIRKGAAVNAVDTQEHWSALMFAAAEGHGQVVKLLLGWKADPTLKDIDGDTAADFARQRGFPAVAETLKAAESAGEGERE